MLIYRYKYEHNIRIPYLIGLGTAKNKINGTVKWDYRKENLTVVSNSTTI